MISRGLASPLVVAVAMALPAAGCSPMSPYQDARRGWERSLAAAEAARAYRAAEVHWPSKPLQVETAGPTWPSVVAMPPHPVPGECYELVLIPTQYETRKERILAREAAEQIEIALGESAEREQPTEAGGEAVATEPAGSPDLVVVPPEYLWEEEEILVAPAERIWKKNCLGLDGARGSESFCVVEQPARFETVRKQVVVEPAESRLAAIASGPSDSRGVGRPSPAVSARQTRVPIPARYQTISKKVRVAGQRLEWRRVLCEQSLRPETVRAVQTALEREGFDPGPIDGRLGPRTHDALSAYQRSRDLPSGAPTVATLEALGVTMR